MKSIAICEDLAPFKLPLKILCFLRYLCVSRFWFCSARDHSSHGFARECASEVAGYEAVDDLDLAHKLGPAHEFQHDGLDGEGAEVFLHQVPGFDLRKKAGFGVVLLIGGIHIVPHLAEAPFTYA